MFQVSTPQEADEKLQELIDDREHEWGIVYIEESLAEPIEEHITALNKKVLPVISIFPSSGKKKGIAGKMLNGLVRKATGVEMRFE